MLELSLKHASFEYEYSNKDQMRVLEVLIAFYVQMAHRQKNKDMCHEYFIKASTYFSKFRDESSFNDMVRCKDIGVFEINLIILNIFYRIIYYLTDFCAC